VKSSENVHNDQVHFSCVLAFQREKSGGANLTSYIRTTSSEICRHRLACEWSTDRFLWSSSRTFVHLEFNSLRLKRLYQNCSSLIALYENVNSRYFIDNLMALYQIQGSEHRTKQKD
jgi:hypothetical protein